MALTKRIFDITLSTVGLAIFAPLVPVIAILIKLDSRGPVFHAVDRVGQGMRPFKMYKFRTMFHTDSFVGASVCAKCDPRVTPFGRFLRRTKLNEFPQLFNIFLGDMTFVGPRPEAPDLAKLYPEEGKKVFSVKPGIVSSGTIAGRNEEDLYPPGIDPTQYYIKHILPSKLRLDMDCIDHPAIVKDLLYIFRGVIVTAFGALSKRHIQTNRSQIYLFIGDLFLIVMTYSFCYHLYGSLTNHHLAWLDVAINLPIILVIRLILNLYCGLYSCLIRYISFREILGVLKAVTSGTFFIVLAFWTFDLGNYPILFAVLEWAAICFLLSSLRAGLSIYWKSVHAKENGTLKRKVLIYGVGNPAYMASQKLHSERWGKYEIVGFIDDSADKYGKRFNGARIIGNRHQIGSLTHLYKIDEILIADPDANPQDVRETILLSQKEGLRCRLLSTSRNIDKTNGFPFFRDCNISDILCLPKIQSDTNRVKEIISGKRILVYGSGGALGLELCKKVLALGCEKLILVDRYESYLQELLDHLNFCAPANSIVPVLYHTETVNSFEHIFDKYRPEVIFHAGMRKYEPRIQIQLEEMCRANYETTWKLAKAAERYGCEILTLISSHLAGLSGNDLGEWLRMAETSLDSLLTCHKPHLVITRICNVLENRGSPVSVLEDQIRKGETILLREEMEQLQVVSKESATEFILQSLVDAKESNFGTKRFTINGGRPLSMCELLNWLGYFHGTREWDVKILEDLKSGGSGTVTRQKIEAKPPT